MYIYIPSVVDAAHCIMTVLCEGYPLCVKDTHCVWRIPHCVWRILHLSCVLISYLQSTIMSILQSSIYVVTLQHRKSCGATTLAQSCSVTFTSCDWLLRLSFRTTMPVFQLPKRSAGRQTLCFFFAASVSLVLTFDQCWQIWSVARKDFGTLWIGTGWR